MTQLNEKFHDLLTKRQTETERRIDELNQRITNLQQHFEEEKAAVLKYVDDRGEELTRMLNKFKVRRLILGK